MRISHQVNLQSNCTQPCRRRLTVSLTPEEEHLEWQRFALDDAGSFTGLGVAARLECDLDSALTPSSVAAAEVGNMFRRCTKIGQQSE